MSGYLRVLRSQIRQRGWDAFWVVYPPNRRFVTGFTGSSGWVLVPAAGTQRNASLLTDGRYSQQAKQECPGIAILNCGPDLIAAFVHQLKKWKVTRLGFEDEYVAVRAWRSMRKKLPGLNWKPALNLVEAARALKDSLALSYIKKAVSIAEKAFKQVLPALKAGMQEREVAFRLEKAMLELGAESPAFPTIVASGPNSAMPHAQPTTRRLRSKDLVIMDFGCTFKGYHSDLTRTVVVDKMTSKQREYYRIVKKAQKLSKKLLNSGEFASKSDQKAREIFKQFGLDKNFIHSLGHGLGLEIHEAPRLAAKSTDRLHPGMVVTCEPGIYLPGWGGIRIEDDIAIGSDSADWLSNSPEELQILGRRSVPI